MTGIIGPARHAVCRWFERVKREVADSSLLAERGAVREAA